MELIFDVVKYGVLGFFGLIAGLFVLALLFGKRIEKKWEYEADFHDARGREIGEFDIEMSRIAKEEPDYSLRAKFVLRHPALARGDRVRVHLDDMLVMEGVVRDPGRIRLGLDDLVNEPKSPQAGQICTVHCGDAELFAEPLHID